MNELGLNGAGLNGIAPRWGAGCTGLPPARWAGLRDFGPLGLGRFVPASPGIVGGHAGGSFIRTERLCANGAESLSPGQRPEIGTTKTPRPVGPR
jgi:hypothetical protein